MRKKTCRPLKGSPIPHWYTTAADLPDAWDAALPEYHFLKKNSLLAHEKAAVPDTTVLYCNILEDDQPMLQCAFQVLSVKEKHLGKHGLKPWQHRAWRALTALLSPKLLIAGQLFRHDAITVFTSEKLSPFEAFVQYRAAIEAAVRRSGAQAVLVKDCPESLAVLFQHHAPEFFLLRNDISMEMALQPAWESITGYEKDLKHKYAQRYRNVRKRMDGITVKEFSAQELSVHARDVFALYLGVTENQQVRLGLLSESFLPALKGFYEEELRVWGFFEDGILIAFASAFVHEQSLDMFYIGFDYKRNTELQLYFNILFFAIEQAIALHKPLLILGRTALDAKARVGCQPRYLHSFLYIRNPVLRNIIGRLLVRFSEGSEWEERHPFKFQQ